MYIINELGGINRVSDGALIPKDPDNVDFIAYLQYLAANPTDDGPEAPVEPKETPES